MVRAGALAVLLFLPAVAAAQDSTTTCRSFVPGTVTCQTQGQPTIAPPINYSAQLNPVPPPDFALRAYEAQRAESRQRLINQVAPLMAAGQCETARQLAARGGDAELANTIAATCKPAS